MHRVIPARSLPALLLTLLAGTGVRAAPHPESRFGEEAQQYLQSCRWAEKHPRPPLPSAEVLRRADRAARELDELNRRLWEVSEAHASHATRWPIKDVRRIETEGRACVGLLAKVSDGSSMRAVARLNTQIARVEPGRKRFLRDAERNGFSIRLD